MERLIIQNIGLKQQISELIIRNKELERNKNIMKNIQDEIVSTQQKIINRQEETIQELMKRIDRLYKEIDRIAELETSTPSAVLY